MHAGRARSSPLRLPMQVPRCKSLHHKLLRENCGECAPPRKARAKDGARPPLTLAFCGPCLCLSGLKMGIEHGIVASAKWRCQCKSQHHKLMRENCGVRAAQSA